MALAYVGPIMLATHSQEPFHGGYATRKAASASSAHRSTQSLGVAVLYSGRFYGALTPKEWVRDHMEHLIKPNRATVFVVPDFGNVCDQGLAHLSRNGSAHNGAGTHALMKAARLVFHGWLDLHARLAPNAVAINIPGKFNEASRTARLKGWPERLSQNRLASMYNWAKQFQIIGYGMALVREVAAARASEYAVVVRMRMDVQLALPHVLSPRSVSRGDVVLALGYHGIVGGGRFDVYDPYEESEQLRVRLSRDAAPPCASKADCHNTSAIKQVLWHDWIYVGSQRSMSILGDVSSAPAFLVDLTMRCLGICQEEQTVLQLAAKEIRVEPLGWTAVIIRRLEANAVTMQSLSHQKMGPCDPKRAVLAPVTGKWTSTSEAVAKPSHNDP